MMSSIVSSKKIHYETTVPKFEVLLRQIELLETQNQVLKEEKENRQKLQTVFLVFNVKSFEYLKWIQEQVLIEENTKTTKYTVCLETAVYIMLKTFQKLTNISIKEIISEALFLFIKAYCFENGNEDLKRKIFIESAPLKTYESNNYGQKIK